MNSMRAIILIAIAAMLAVISIAIFAPDDAEPAPQEQDLYRAAD